ncbi:MAG: ABC transporter permease [Chitinophagaceae bacterium]|nr:ABC transporter permease [Chitinophagaceae bacterium]
MFHVFIQNCKMALEELRTNKLRTFLSLLGVTIGVFCIISVLTVFDSLQNNIQTSMQSLGSNVLYIGKFPWIPEESGEYPMWKYKARPVCNYAEMMAIHKYVNSASYTAISYSDESENIKFGSNEFKGVGIFAVTYDFNKLQSIDINDGRYFSLSEMQGTQSNGIVIGATVAEQLFGNSISPIGKYIDIFSRSFQIIGVMKKQGKTMTGFNFDGGAIISYNYLSSFRKIDNNIGSGFTDPIIMVKARKGFALDEMKYEIKSVLRANRKLRPSEADTFSFNQLDSIQKSISAIFINFNIFGWIIGFFSLIVGSFGIANIMFVSVKERTRFIGVKKAIGARKFTILSEFLIESVILCMMGGLIGILFVMILSKILSGPLGFPVELSMNNFLLGLGISVMVGIIAGYIPAKRAANLDPVVAIRS